MLEKLPNGRYRLVTLDAPIGIRDGLLWAYDDSPIDDKRAEEWYLNPHVVRGKEGMPDEVYYTSVLFLTIQMKYITNKVVQH